MSNRICLLTGHPKCLSAECEAGRIACVRSRAPAPIQAAPLIARHQKWKAETRDLFRLLQSTGAIETYRARPSIWRRLFLALT